MSIEELRLQLHEVIDTITDSAKLQALNTLLQGSRSSHKSMSIEEYVGAIDEARQQIKEGKYLSIDELEKESDNW